MEGDLALAVVGGGVAGAWLARAMRPRRPEWSIALSERTNRIGGRLRSIRIPELSHPIELGGMRYLTSHRLVQGVIDDFGIATRAFDTIGGPDRSYLRGVFGHGPSDPGAGKGYDLAPQERGRSALDLAEEAFMAIVPDMESLVAAGWRRLRASGQYRGRPLRDWSVETALGPFARRSAIAS